MVSGAGDTPIELTSSQDQVVTYERCLAWATSPLDIQPSEVILMPAPEVVRTSVAAPFFDIGITELFRAAFGSYQTMVDRGVEFVVAEAGLRYHRPAHFDDQVTLEIAVTRLGTT